MGRAKIVTYYNDRYRGSLTEDQCEAIENLLELDSNNGCVTDLLHVVYQLSDSDVEQIIEDYEEFGELEHDIEKPLGTLRADQTTGVALMYYAGNCILGDSTGLGKTVEVAGLCNLLRIENEKRGTDFNYILLTEKNLTAQTRQKMIKFTGEFVDLLQDGEYKNVNSFIEKYDCNEEYCSFVGPHSLIKQSSFLTWVERLHRSGDFPFDMLIIDESSILGNSKTEITKSFKLIKNYFKRVIFLNATPFETKLSIFYTQLDLLDSKLLPTKTNFQKEYVKMDYRGMYPRPTGKYKNQAQFKRLVGYRYFARTRRDKGAEMRDCKGGIELSPLSDAQKVLLSRTQMLRMVYDCPTSLDPSIEFCIENVPKLGSLKKLLKEYADNDTVLIFSHYKETQRYLSKWLDNLGYSNRILNGDTDNKERFEIIESFKRSEFDILVTSVQKGLDFGNCNNCIFYSYDPNPSSMIQFEGRITRDFDIVGKNVYILCSEGREYKTLLSSIKDRARATADFTKTDLSIVMDILLNKEEKDGTD